MPAVNLDEPVEIIDHDPHLAGRFRGERERLRLGLATASLEFEHMKSGVVLLHFSDGRPYVNLDLRSGTWAAAHDCGPDQRCPHAA